MREPWTRTMVWESPHATSPSRTASSWTAGAGPADYSGAHSKRTLNTTQARGPGGGQVTTAITGSRHGKKTCSTPLGCRTTTTFTNGNGNRRCNNLLATLPLFELGADKDSGEGKRRGIAVIGTVRPASSPNLRCAARALAWILQDSNARC